MVYNSYNGNTLAYIGDAVLEVYIRGMLLNKGYTKVNDLHKLATKYTNAKSHHLVMKHILENDFFTEVEVDIFKRGRNNKSNSKRKNTSIEQYNFSTGFEACIGYHHLSGNIDRLNEILSYFVTFIDGRKD